ncbi:FAD-dependent oxidoreductase, partial [Micromonospora arborensis]
SASLVGGHTTSPMTAPRAMWADVQAAPLPAEPTIEWDLPPTVDPSLSDAAGPHSSPLLVPPVPFQLAVSDSRAAVAPPPP